MAEQSRTQNKAAKVEAITEMLEKIILELPPRKMLAVVRVSHRWKSLIEGTPTIRKQLCPPSSNTTISQRSSWEHVEHFEPKYDHPLTICPLLTHTTRSRQSHYRRFLEKRESWIDRTDFAVQAKYDEYASEKVILIGQKGKDSDRRPLSWTRAEASWRTLFWTNPPCKEAHATVQDATGLTDEIETIAFSIRDKDGITLGVIEDCVQKVVGDLRCQNPFEYNDFAWRASVMLCYADNSQKLQEKTDSVV